MTDDTQPGTYGERSPRKLPQVISRAFECLPVISIIILLYITESLIAQQWHKSDKKGSLWETRDPKNKCPDEPVDKELPSSAPALGLYLNALGWDCPL